MELSRNLEHWEKQIELGLESITQGTDLVVISLHHILKDELWKDVVEDGFPAFRTSTDYLKDLAQRHKVTLQTIYNYKNTGLLAFDKVGVDYDQFIEYGGNRSFNLLNNLHVPEERLPDVPRILGRLSTGEILPKDLRDEFVTELELVVEDKVWYKLEDNQIKCIFKDIEYFIDISNLKGKILSDVKRRFNL